MKMKSSLLCATLLATSTWASAATIANYELSGTLATGDTSTVAGITGITAGTLTNSSNPEGFESVNKSYSAYETPDGGDAFPPLTTNWFFSANQKDDTETGYVQFTVTVDASYQLDNLTVYADMAVAKQRIGGVVSWQMVLRSSEDNYTADLGSNMDISGLTDVGSTLDDTPYYYGENDISTGSIGSQMAGAVSYRLFITDLTDSGNPRKDLILNNLRLEGSMVPEPSSAGLLGLGSLALMLRRRRG